ncbi:MAG: ImmA/IrrE family metallo-endopeptidase [Clostridiales bacterium]|nr:ImmA/IrrE family metallo-endopeptidase [Clostridiales bacterium]
MGLRSDSYYRQIAAEALQRAEIDEPPVPLEEIVHSVGIPLRTATLPAFFSGAIVHEDGLPVILLNTARPEGHRRSTLAHLLGHVLIVLADPHARYPRNLQAEHAEADLVAEELVLPEYLVRDQAFKWFNDYRYLARLFGVTEGAMMERMRSLGIIKRQGIMWDY